VTAGIVAVAPSETVAFILQMAGLGALIGSAYAAWRRSQDPEFDTWWPPIAVGLGLAAVAAGAALLEQVL
jgi:hypothetical protein